MDDLEWISMLPVLSQALDQDGTSRIGQNGINSVFSRQDYSGLPNQKETYTFCDPNGFWSTNVQDDTYTTENGPQAFNCDLSIGFTHGGGDLGSINQANVDGFLDVEAPSIGMYPGLFGDETNMAIFGISQTSGYGSHDLDIEMLNSTFNPGGLNEVLMLDLDFPSLPAPQHDFSNQENFSGGLTYRGFDTPFPQDAFIRSVNQYGSNGDYDIGDIQVVSGHTESCQTTIPIDYPIIQISRKRKKSKEVGTPENKMPKKIDWESWRKPLYSLYIKQNHTAEEVVFELSIILGFTPKLSTCQKKFTRKEWLQEFHKNERGEDKLQITSTEQTSGNAARTRSAAVNPETTGSPSAFSRKSTDWSAQPSPIPSVDAEPYIHQFRMFHAINGFVKSLFAAKDICWTASITGFVQSGKSAEKSAAWELVSDKCFGIANISRTRVGAKVNFLLKEVFEKLEKATQLSDPCFLTHFPRICLALSSIRLHNRTCFGEFVFLRVFLQRLRCVFLKSIGNGPLVVFVESLLQILVSSPRDLRTTIGLGCWKIIHVLGDMIGHDHIIVLNMGSYCTKHWKCRFKTDEKLLEAQYKPLLTTCHQMGDMQKIAFLYDYIYASSKEKYNSKNIADQVVKLRRLTSDRCRTEAELNNLQYTLATRAFAFSSELLAIHKLETWREEGSEHIHGRDDSFKYMNEAIEVLRHGDLECKVKAAHCSKRLAVWYKSYCPGEKLKSKSQREKGQKAQKEKCRTAEILSGIEALPVEIPEYHCLFVKKGGSKNNRWRRKKRAERDLFCSSSLAC